MIKVIARFKGQDGSLGYTKHQAYNLWFKTEQHWIEIRREDREGLCVYTSLKSFLENWEVLK